MSSPRSRLVIAIAALASCGLLSAVRAQAAPQPPDSLAIDVQTTAGGSVNPGGTVLVARGASLAFTFSAEECYGVFDVIVDDASVGAPASYTFTNVQSDHLLYVQFAPQVPGMALEVLPAVGVCSRPDTLIARVQGATQGQVEFFDADVRLGSASVANGAASLVIKPPMPAGVHTLFSRYSGGACPGSDASAGTIFTALASTPDSLEVGFSLTPSPASDQEGIRASVIISAHGAPLDWMTGTVAVFDDTVQVGSMSLFRGVRTAFLDQTFGAGTHVLTARVTPDGCFPVMTSSPVTLQVFAFQYTTLTLTSDPDPAHPGQPVTVTAHVSPATAPGRVTFLDAVSNVVLATVDLAGGVAAWTHTAQYGSEPTVVAQYPGNHLYGGNNSAPFKVRVIGTRPTSVSLTITPNQLPSVQVPFTFTAHVEPTDATGIVRFSRFDSTYRYDVPVAGGVATEKSLIGPPGRYTYMAVYMGDSLYDESRGYADQTALGQSANTTLLDYYNPSLVGADANIICVVGPPESQGTVGFYVDDAPPVVVPVNFGVANFSTASLPLGDHDVIAWWSEEYEATSNLVTHRIVDGAGARLLVLAPNGGENLVVGQPVEIRWVPYRFTNYWRYDTSVDVSLERAPGAPWELLAHMANTGSFTWTVAGPGTNTGVTRVYSALINVSNRDGAIPSGTSTAPFSIFDATTETVVSRFDAEPNDAGVRVSWVVAATADAPPELQRAPAQDGPWTRLDAPVRQESGTFTVEDHDVVAGATYWYRLFAVQSGTAFALTSATAGLPREFALDLTSANPTRGAVSVRYSVATPSRIRLTMVDLQGREVRVLADGARAAGRYEVSADVRAGGAPLPAGIYFVRLTSPARRLVQRIAIVR